jgi:Glutathione synthase/Ribosomal protein S6 modification enzyme (glutaminyl transferase)
MIGPKTVTRRQRILILSQTLDAHTFQVCQQLDRLHHPWSLFDPGWFPAQSCITAHYASIEQHGWHGTLRGLDGKDIALQEIAVIWNRRPGAYAAHLPAVTEPVEKEFVQREAEHGVGGLLRALPVVWINHPDANRRTSYKPLQLAMAQQLGLTIPRTLITSDPEQLAPFYEECHGDVIYKLLGHPIYYADETRTLSFSTKTSLVTADMLSHAHRLKGTAALFQQRIPKACDVRITIMGVHVFAAAIYPGSEAAQIDFRRDYAHLSYTVCQLPQVIEKSLLQMMQLLHLSYAAIDMIMTPDGDFVFIEINQNGQFGFVEIGTGLPLYAAMAHLLAEGGVNNA